MKIISFFSISLVIVFGGFFQYTYANTIWNIRTNHALVKRYTDWWGNKYAIYSKQSITVITPKKFSMHFFSNWDTAKNIASSYACNAVLNWTYFWFNEDGSYFPAWVWYQFGMYLKQPYQPAIDRNLRVLLSGDWTTINAIQNDSFNFLSLQWKKSWRYANAWPWLVRDGRINPDIVQTKSHWQRDTTRVWFIRNPSGEIHFVVATEPISLPQFISFSYWVWLWTWTFQYVNLDWWSSTTLITPYNSYYSKKKLPSFICIH